ncbi:unnamed protein product, partial [Aureobasidium vineae]
PSDYTVLWICALTIEYVAAQTFLDQEDPRPEAGTISISDTNAYTLGRIAGHRVVLAVLPKGEYGVGSAASVITHILRSFHNIRIGLMVGIGGGAPTKANDIRLGDVVVSSPKDGHGGVYHYDFGKEFQELGYKQTGFLDQPPTVVRNAVSALEARHTLKGHYINQNIENALMKNSRLRKRGYACPGPEQDWLYKADIVHPTPEESCADCCGNDVTKLIIRRPRDDEDDNPAIHYGLIGSGNKVIKDATLRDKLARERGVICFEMEAAGIMNRFPCLIVRGICDYCDSHKNKEWQGYAAMTAAAYTKELLMEIPCNAIEKEERLAVAIERRDDVHTVATSLESIKTSNQSNAVIRWLKAADPSVNFNRAIQAHHPGTGEWFLGSDAFQEWKEHPNSFLWIHGLSGCGKTVLSAAIVRRLLEEQHPPTIYFYFDFSDTSKQHFEDMLRSLLSQLYYELPIAPSIIQECYSFHRQGNRQIGLQQLEDTLRSILEQSPGVRVVLDALDEAQSASEIVQWFRSPHSSEALNVRLLVTSRSQVVSWSHSGNVIPIQRDKISNDIKSYARARLHSEEFKNWKTQQTLRDEVEVTIGNGAGGMFRWAALQLDTLKRCHNRPAIEKALRDLPITLDDTYARTMTLISASPHCREITLILQMLVWSNQHLTLEACNDAISVQPGKSPGFSTKDRFFVLSDVINICSGFVATTVWSSSGNREIQHLRLTHASVKDYLSSEKIIKPLQWCFREEVA